MHLTLYLTASFIPIIIKSNDHHHNLQIRSRGKEGVGVWNRNSWRFEQISPISNKLSPPIIRHFEIRKSAIIFEPDLITWSLFFSRWVKPSILHHNQVDSRFLTKIHLPHHKYIIHSWKILPHHMHTILEKFTNIYIYFNDNIPDFLEFEKDKTGANWIVTCWARSKWYISEGTKPIQLGP